MNKLFLFSLLACTLAACSQPPAPVANYGGQFYGRDGATAFRQPDYIPPKPALAAPVSDMQVTDLSPPVVAAPSSIEVADVPPAQLAPLPQLSSVKADEAPVAAPVALAKPQPKVDPLASEALTAPQPTAKLAELNQRASNFIWPVEGPVISRFGPKTNGLINDGINISAREGEPIWAAASGDVAYAGNELKGYGNMLIIRHANGWMTAYAHTSDMLVSKGDKVKQGDLIGYVGKTGAVQSAQLHFGIREGKTPLDPESLLPRRVASAN